MNLINVTGLNKLLDKCNLLAYLFSIVYLCKTFNKLLFDKQESEIKITCSENALCVCVCVPK